MSNFYLVENAALPQFVEAAQISLHELPLIRRPTQEQFLRLLSSQQLAIQFSNCRTCP